MFEKKIIVNLKGGLGNQLFQYATARSLCEKNKTTSLFFNIKDFNSDYFGRQFRLEHFNLKGRVLKNRLALKAFTKNTKINKIISALGLYTDLTEKKLVLHNLDINSSFFISLTGYWQSACYFNNIRQVLLKELVPLQLPAFPDWVANDNTVAVGVRRKDYLIDANFGFIGLKYYTDALSLFKKKVKDPLFIFFSEDIKWCKENFSDEKAVFLEDPNWSIDYLSVFLMSKCKHQIVSNSSFHWWGAWLNTNFDKIVVRPLRPFNNKSYMYESLYPPEWMVINNHKE